MTKITCQRSLHRFGEFRWVRSLLFIGIAFAIVLCPWAFPDKSDGEGDSLYPSPLDRFGLNVVLEYGALDDYDLGPIRAGWYLDYRFRENPARPDGIEYAQVVRVNRGAFPPDWLALGRAVDANPGALWLIGNEPDAPRQDARHPVAYAIMYHDLYAFIKGHDPAARLAAPNIVQPTPLRLRWLDRVLDVYRLLYDEAMPVDVWSIHNQILQEDRNDWGCNIPPGIENVDQGTLYSVYDNTSIEIFRQHIIAFREWMRAHGEQDKPLIISEYGVLMPSEYLGGGDAHYGDQVVKEFMTDSFDYLLSATDEALGCPADGHRLVQRWAWYSLNDKLIDLQTFEGFNGSLYDWRYRQPGVITQFGLEYVRYTSSLMALPDREVQLP